MNTDFNLVSELHDKTLVIKTDETISHFTKQDDIGILSTSNPQGFAETHRMRTDFSLGKHTLSVRMDKFQGIFNCDDMSCTGVVYVIDHGGQGRGFPAARRSGDQDQALIEFCDLFYYRREIEFLNFHDFSRNNPKDSTDAPVLKKHVASKSG